VDTCPSCKAKIGISGSICTQCGFRLTGEPVGGRWATSGAIFAGGTATAPPDKKVSTHVASEKRPNALKDLTESPGSTAVRWTALLLLFLTALALWYAVY
jgi:hypothetical protein